jgi:hypothetical protein
VANDETLDQSAGGSSDRAANAPDPDVDSGNGDDREHWLKVEDLLRQRRSNLLDFGLPTRLVDRPGR